MLFSAVFAVAACRSDRPSVNELGAGAYKGGLTDDKNAMLCVGKLIRDADLSTDTLKHIARGDLAQDVKTWNIGEDEGGAFQYDVEWKMPKICHVKPWPGIDNWPGDPNRS